VAHSVVLHGAPGSEAAALLLGARAELEHEARRSLNDACFDLSVEVARPFAQLFAAVVDDQVVGFLIGWSVADELHILSVVVLPEHRRRGHGRALVDRALEVADATGARVVLLEVRRGNARAIRTYRGAGFVAVGLRRDYYNDGEDAVEMAFARDAAVLAAFDRLEDGEL
jgi:ribosomal-protein-alanine N-acetyltransferase